MPRRKPQIIRHITQEDEDDSEELPEVNLEPEASSEEEIQDDESADGTHEEAEVEEEDVAEVIEDEEEEEVKMVNGDDNKVEITKDDKGNEILPDGTLVLQPEEVSEENDEFSGPEFKKTKKSVVMEDLEGTYKCTSCHEQLNHNNPKHVYKHQLLGVLLCRQCYKYLSSGNFDIDDEGSEDQCTWCGEGGKLICCDSCPKAFCRSCIKTNLGRAELTSILEDEDDSWLCYVCNPAGLVDLQEECLKVMYHLKKQAEVKELKKTIKDVKSKRNKKDEGNDLMKVMQLIGDKSSKSKNILEDIVKGKSPKGLKKTLDLFKDLKKFSEDLENRIRNELNEDEEEEEEEEEKSSTKSSTESDKHSIKDGKKEKARKAKREEESAQSDGDDNVDEKKSSHQTKKSAKDKRGKAASTSPSEDDVPGTSSGSVKGNKSSSRKGRRTLFKAQQKEKSSSSEESDESSEEEEEEEDSDWEAESGVKERRQRRASKKGKAGGKLSAKKLKEGRASSSDDDADDESRRKRKKKKSKRKGNGSDSDPEIQFPKKESKKRGPGEDSSNVEGSAEDDSSEKKKRTKKSKKSKDGDISLSSEYEAEEELEESDSYDSSAEEDSKKIKKAMQNAKKGTKENKQDLGSDAEDKIAERLLMEEAEEEEAGSKGSESSDPDLEDAKKKRDKRNKKRDRKRKKKSELEDDEGKEEEKESKSKPKKKSRAKRKDKSESDDEEVEESEEDKPRDRKGRKRSKKQKHHLLQVKISESESEDDDKKKPKRKPARKKKKKKEDSDDLMTSAESSSDSSDVQPKKKGRKRKAKKGVSTDEENNDRSYKKKKGKRRRIKETATSASGTGSGSDQEAKNSDASVKEASGSGGSGDDEENTPGKHRKQIRKVLKKSKLLKTTLEAELAEKERRERIKARRKELFGEEEAPEQVETLDELVLEYGKDKKEKLIEVDTEIVINLKPHQVEGVQFLWDSTFESLEKKDEPGGGAILAHCMGLGKTLQIITYLHTIMKYEELNVKRALVVAPLNTVLNWVEEFNKWLSHDDSIDVYEITSVKNNEARADMLEQWHEEGGVLVMGYSMYRILTLNAKLKKKRLKKIFKETLIDPGPDVVVCDEGHMLKNSATAIAKALNSVKTRRRVCLTGTPLQNNLIEYHCMVDFVKPNLLGSQKEYKNRFVNPITNGQCSDSTSRDVRIMKHRAHILHDLLAGCVQRKDYSVITKFLPPKHEFVLSIRLSPKQIKLYEVYLGQYSGMKKEDGSQVQQRSASVFADYQSLMRIWTHPQVLKLNTIREENRAWNDMDDFVTSEEDTDGGSIDDFIDDKQSDSDVEEVSPVKLPEVISSTRGSRTSARQAAAAISSKKQNGDKGSRDEDGEKDGNKSDSSLEIIKTWKTRSRTLDPEGDNVVDRTRSPTPTLRAKEWYEEYFDPEADAYNLELSGKLVLLFEILKYCETIGEKILVFSQSLLSLDLIEDFLENLNKQAEEARDKDEQDLENQIGGTGAWIKGEDYFRMDGSTSAAYRHRWCDIFNDRENLRSRLFLISTKAGSLGVNLVGANRVIIFDASWNPSHDTQSIFRVYRFGQDRPVFIYRFVAQGTMEEKIYERQVAKQSLSQRVVDEHQIERHFSAGQLQELYTFTPDRLDDPDRKEQPIPALPKDYLLAELLKTRKEWIVKYHEHDSLLENKIEEELSEEDRKAAWDDYNAEKEGRFSYMTQQFTNQYANYHPGAGAGATPMMLQIADMKRLYEDGNNVLQTGQSLLGQQYRNIQINGRTYRVPESYYNQQLLMRQYQALQQQRQRQLQMMPQGVAGNQSVSQLLANSYGGEAAATNQSSTNLMSNLLSRMSQQAGSAASSQAQPRPVSLQTSNLYEALKKTAEKQNQQKQNGQNGGGSVLK